MDSFTFNGVSSATLGMHVYPTDTMNVIPARVVSTYTVPGRSGDLIIDEERYDNVEREYGFVIYEGVQQNLQALRNLLSSGAGYYRLEDTFDPDHYFMAQYKAGKDPVMWWRTKDAVKGTITFDRKPQRYLKSGETPILLTSSSATVTNPTVYASKPLLHIPKNFTSGRTYGVNDVTIEVKPSSIANDVYIDCETGEAYLGSGGSFNDYVIFSNHDLPVLMPGENTIIGAFGTTYPLNVYPRWWEL